MDSAAPNTSIDWSAEPDIELLNSAISGLPSNSSHSIDVLKGLAWRGSVMAMLNLGWIYAETRYVTTDVSEAEGWIQRAFERGSIEASFRLGIIYNRRKEYEKARLAFEFGAERHYSPSMNRLGIIYNLGIGVKKDTAGAIAYWRSAADLGHVRAKGHLGRAYLHGKCGITYIPVGAALLAEAIRDAIRVGGRNPPSVLLR
jgi:TPR repeat protein